MPFGRWTLCPSFLEVVGVLLVFSRGEVCFGRQHRGDDTSYSSNASSEEEERFSSVSGRGWMEIYGDGDGGVDGGGWRVRTWRGW